MLERYLSQTKSFNTSSNLLKQNMILPESYPQFFSTSVLPDGFIASPNEVRAASQQVISMPALAHLETTKAIAPYLQQCISSLQKFSKTAMTYGTITKEEQQDILESLHAIHDAYDE